MLGVTVLCIGSLKENYLKAAAAEYEKRLAGFCKLSIIEVEEERIKDNPKDAEIEAVIKKEGKKLLQKLPSNAKIIAMCIEGKQQSSEEMSLFIEKSGVDGFGNICYVIGGSHGLSDEVKNIAHLKLSMSKMTFPHQLARVMLEEQIYRAFKIISGGKYHK